MKYFSSIFFISCLIFQPWFSISQGTNKDNLLLGVFDGRTPCRELANQIRETTTSDCIKIKWRLMLYKDAATTMAGTYKLLGFMYKKDNPLEGKWHILKGTATDPQAIVYRLNLEGKEPLLLQKGDDNILFFLDRNKKLLVGNKDFSYTLNRISQGF